MSIEKKNKQKRITIKDIASKANVSVGTVDRVLHNRGEVSRSNRELISRIVEELEYTPNLIAKSLALKKSFNIAVLIPHAGENNPYWEKPAKGFFKAASELNDYNTAISIFNYNLGDETSFISEFKRILTTNPDGVIVAPHFHKAAAYFVNQCRKRNIPVILVDNKLKQEQGLAYFGQNAFQSGKAAANLMHYKLEKGSSVLIINLAPNMAITHHMELRAKGFINYFSRETPGLEIQMITLNLDLLDESALSKTLDKALAEHPETGGIFVTNSRVRKVARYFDSVGKRDLMLIGYDMVDDNLHYMEKGIIDILICQKPVDQGYLSAMAMFNHLFTGKKIEEINYSPIDIIIKENIQYYKKQYN